VASAEKTESKADLDTRCEDGVDTCIQVISCQTALLQTSVTTLKSRAGASKSAPPRWSNISGEVGMRDSCRNDTEMDCPIENIERQSRWH